MAHEPYEGGANIEVTNGLETWFSSSVQNSEMTGTTMAFNGNGAGTAISVPLSSPLTSQGQSKFDLYFTVDQPTEYRLTGIIGETGHQDSVAIVRLTLVGGGDLEYVESSTNSSRPVDLAGVLEPGSYRFYAEATGRGRTGPLLLVSHGTATCNVEFSAGIQLYHPADWNQDGVRNTSDFFDFLVDFQAGGADFNRDNITNTLDFFEFLLAFQQ